MNSTYHFLPWLRAGLSSRLRRPADAEDPRRGHVSLAGTLNDAPLDLPPVEILGPADVVGLDRAQVVRTDPVAGARGFDSGQFVTVDFDSPTLPWLFTPRPPDGDRLAPWLCLVVVGVQRGVSLSANARRGIAELTIAAPADAAIELPNLDDVWMWAHVQYSGSLDDGVSLGQAILRHPERAVSRLICPTALHPDRRYYACVVPTFAIGRDAALGRPLATTLDPAWSPADHAITLPVYYHWEFTTGAGAQFTDLVRALRFRPAPAGIGQRPFELVQSGLPVAEEATMPPFVGALCGRDTDVEPAPDWVRHALAPMVGPSGTAAALLYGGEQANATTVAATDPGWLGELNLDPRHRAVASLGAAVVRDRQEDLAAAAWAQVGDLDEANQTIENARFAAGLVTGRLDRHIAGLPTATLAQFAAPLQRTAAADAESTNAFRRIARPRGPFARRTVAPSTHTAPEAQAAPGGQATQSGASTASAEEDRAALLALLAPSSAVVGRLRQRVGFAAAGATVDLTPLSVAPRIPTPMAPELARLAPEFLLPGADAIPANSVVALKTNPRFVAAFLAGMNSELASELRWRQFPLDGSATPIREFWDRRGQGGGPGSSDIEEIAAWDRNAGLGQLVSGSSGGAQVVLAVRGDLLRLFPRTVLYAIRAVDGDHIADEAVSTNVAYPIFSGLVEPDIRFFGFPLSTDEAIGAGGGPGWFFAFQEQPTETRFGPPDEGPPGAGAANAAEVAQRLVRLPMRVIVHASTLLAPAQGVQA